MQTQWNMVDAYLGEKLIAPDDALNAALEHSQANGLPAIQVSPTEGKLLAILARSVQARRILEIGTLGGYSTIWLGRALPPDGRLITLELDAKHARVAEENIARAGLQDRVEVRVGRALDSLATLAGEGGDPFDFVFIDADKLNTLEYYEYALRLTRPGSLIVLDNVVRGGEVANPNTTNESALGIRRWFDAVQGDTRVMVSALQTVGSKAYDGMALALVV